MMVSSNHIIAGLNRKSAAVYKVWLSCHVFLKVNLIRTYEIFGRSIFSAFYIIFFRLCEFRLIFCPLACHAAFVMFCGRASFHL